MTTRLVATVCATVDRLCPFQYRAFQDLSMLHIHKRHLVFGVFAGLASMAAGCSGGDTPTAPSKTTDTMQFHRGSNDTEVSRGGVGKTLGQKDKRGHAGQKHSPGDRRRRIEYCRNLSAGHQDYDKCQQWLDKIAGRGPDRGGRELGAAGRRCGAAAGGPGPGAGCDLAAGGGQSGAEEAVR